MTGKNSVLIVLATVFIAIGCAHAPVSETVTEPTPHQAKTPELVPGPTVVTIDVKRADAPAEANGPTNFTPCNGVYVRPNLIVTVGTCFAEGIYGNEAGTVLEKHYLESEENIIKISGIFAKAIKVTFSNQNGLVFIQTSNEEPYLTPLPETKPNTNRLRLSGHVRIGDSMTVSDINYPTGVTNYGYETEPTTVAGKDQAGIIGTALVNDQGQLVGIISYGDRRTLGVIPVRIIAEAAKEIE